MEEFKHCDQCGNPPECGSWASCHNKRPKEDSRTKQIREDAEWWASPYNPENQN